MKRFLPLLLISVAVPSAASAQSAPAADTVFVAAPTGEEATDRAAVQAAFDAVTPEGTVQFATGTYLLGRGADLTVPDVTVLGHPDGTVLRGCAPDRFDLPAEGDAMAALGSVADGCTGLYVLADRQTIRGLTFDHTWHGIHVSEPLWRRGNAADPSTIRGYGGHVIEGNVFRYVPNGIRVVGPTDDVTVIRDNRVENAYHAFQSNGAPVHVLDNRISVPEPHAVPTSKYPESGIILSPGMTPDGCEGSRVAGNVIDGTVNGIQVMAGGFGQCRDHEIRDNEIRVRAVPLPPDYPDHLRTLFFGEDMEGSAVTGTAIRLDGRLDAETGATSAAPAAATITDVVVENNRVIGGHGLGILVAAAADNRIVGNEVSGIRERSPFPGLTWGEDPSHWRDANGAGIWVAPGSDRNVIAGNTFEDLAGAAAVVEGDENRLELGADEDLRDRGRGNELDVRSDD